MLRDAIRSLAEAKIAPYAAVVDEEARFRRRPWTHWSPPTCTPCMCRSRPAARVPTRSPR